MSYLLRGALKKVVGRSAEEAAVLARFAQQYAHAQSDLLVRIERTVCGCDYGATSWTTREEAARIPDLLSLRSGQRILELGAGSGWPGLYIASIGRCDVALVDLPIEGLRIAAGRAASEMIPGVSVAVADGAQLPFKNQAFHGVTHSDVLCCLQAKETVFLECRRVIRPGGRMVFSVISVAPALSAAAHARAVAAGPPFKAVGSEYPAMLAQTGWRMLDRTNVTAQYSAAVQQRLREEEANATALIPVLGEAEFQETLTRRRRTAEAIGEGLLERELYVALAPP